jgi:DNA-binding response OmpR family regulator
MPDSPQHRLLIVEDEPSLLASFQEYFEAHGFVILATGDRETALDWLKWQHIDGVISDIHLTDRHQADGLEIALAAWNIGVPIMLITGQPTDDLSNDPRLAKIAGLVRKPISLAALRNMVDAMLNEASNQQARLEQNAVRELLETYAPWLLASLGKPQ